MYIYMCVCEGGGEGRVGEEGGGCMYVCVCVGGGGEEVYINVCVFA